MKKLTISLISSGRDTIELCLRSILPLKSALDGEIIIVNTSKEGKYREICEKYADKVIDFEWCDDFSAARNVGLELASGEWFLYIDDDEFIVDDTPIIDFLRSEESKKYSWCNLKILNYTDYSFKNYGEAWVSRMVRLNRDIRFTGTIHEHFTPLIGKSKSLDGIIGHTGYIFKDKEAQKAHARRNIRLLDKEIAKNPRNTRWWVQLIQEYGAIDDYNMLHQLCETYLGLVSHIKITPENKRYILNITGLFIVGRMYADIQNNNLVNAKKFYERYARRSYGVIADAQLSLMGATIYFNTNDYNKASRCCANYMSCLKKYSQNEKSYSQDMLWFFAKTFEPESLSCMQTIINKIIERQA